MSSLIVFQQMLIMLILICAGYVSYKKNLIGDEGSKAISYLVLTFTNPALILNSAFSDDIGEVTHGEIIQALILVSIGYAVLLVVGHVLPFLMRSKPSKRKFYTMLSVYSNVGFIGIPVASAVLGEKSLVFVTVFIVIFNLLFYTHGHIYFLRGAKGADYKISLGSFINVGTVVSLITLVVIWFNLRFPMVIEDTVSYAGRSTTFLAMIVLGISFAKTPFKNIVGDARIYVMIAVRYLAFPIIATLVLKNLFGTTLLIRTMSLLLSLPAGNAPLLLATKHNMQTDTMSAGLILTTVFAVATVTVTSLFL